MTRPTIDDLTEEVAGLRLECETLRRQACATRRHGLLIVFGLTALGLVGARLGDGPKSIEAERFVVKGEDGITYAELGLYQSSDGTKSGATRLAFFDKNGTYRTNYGIGSTSDPYLHMMDREGKMLASMEVDPNGWCSLAFREISGKTGVTIGSTNSSGVVLRGPGREGFQQQAGGLLVTENGSAALNFFRPGTAKGQDVHERVRVGVNGDGTPGIVLRGANYDVALKAQVTAGAVSVQGLEGK